MMETRLTRSFFSRDTVEVAQHLLGQRLVRQVGGRRLSGLITETEAYRGEEDLACHARAGRTPRTEVMYGLPGHAYVYFIYGAHWLLNFVTEQEGYPGAVLIRAVEPQEGLDLIAARRLGQPAEQWTNGPAKLCQAFEIAGPLNGLDICAPGAPLFLESGIQFDGDLVKAAPRVGLKAVPEPWKSIAWRFVVNYQSLQASSAA